MMLRAFIVNDDVLGMADPDERHSLLVWAQTPEKALGIAFAEFETPYIEDCDWDCADESSILAGGFAPPDDPGVETRPEVLRLAGFAEGDEPRCATCGLASMGMPQHAICPLCEDCRSCQEPGMCFDASYAYEKAEAQARKGL